MKHPEIWQQMMSGEPYDAAHPYFAEQLARTRDIIWEYNNLRPSDTERRQTIMDSLLGSHGKIYHINQPFRCDYGENIHIGENFLANFNLTILDEARVTIGDNVFIGPNVSIYTACHPLDAETRRKWVEWAEPVTIGNDVWIGGNTVILPGVTIGNGVVIGAGSVVSRDIPDYSLAVGNPARVIRDLKGRD
ncbi:MAG: sugar O-acetyltransferase [Muribaculaceae bacterium]|nr:sugar O-acetyltransferase [Muribaculaceae bacterium]